MPDRATCLTAMRSRDPRFDGHFFTAVRTTGIYCRPSCPALIPRPENVGFFPSAAAAQDAGYRACRRCRPDAVPGSPEWDTRGDVVGRAVRLIGDGVVEREGVHGLAARLGYSVRQVQRLTQLELGASPLALARSQRAHTARLLIETTDLSMAEVAFAAGFGSVRSFNDAVTLTYARTPTELRARRRSPRRPDDQPLGQVDLRLPFRTPFEPGNVFGHLAATAVPGVEEWRDGAYRRTLALPHGAAIVALRPRPDHVAATMWLADPRDLTPAIGRCRRLLDLDADPVAVDAHLAADAALAALVARAPGRRVPRTVDPAEFAVRAVLGQQVSTAAARTHAGRLVRRFGERVTDPAGGLTHLFPTSATLAGLGPGDLAMPASRVATLTALAKALADGTLDLSPGADWAAARAGLGAIAGVGPWTVEIVAMRALGDPDAFPASDLGVRRALSALVDERPDPSRWRPWRSYATQYLWAPLPHPINDLPTATHVRGDRDDQSDR
ncbi:MAG TPA: AlkA N-terminal domain-containing protein [Propionibacteriaceae bacterium]|nr:AlkA N-terminal domain-containing protein [Propionibacteriaceae bacterium]